MGSPLPAHSFSRFDFFYVTEEKREKMSEAWQKVTEEAKKEVEDAITSANKRYTMLNHGPGGLAQAIHAIISHEAGIWQASAFDQRVVRNVSTSHRSGRGVCPLIG